MKTDAKTAETIPPASAAPRFPRPALWLRPPAGHSYGVPLPASFARLNVVPVDVLAVQGGTAIVIVREHACVDRRTVPVDQLASSVKKAMPRIAARLSAMMSRPAITALPGVTDVRAETPSFFTPSLTGGEAIVTEGA
ncbi:hypothetical protein OpiT1DRAFT_01219 [Opitutaceae bacterium TAV1]|nr:hypothetical protein OpiT1DRAFT_01219 [Opitutaceae bacterium TAV1]